MTNQPGKPRARARRSRKLINTPTTEAQLDALATVTDVDIEHALTRARMVSPRLAAMLNAQPEKGLQTNAQL